MKVIIFNQVILYNTSHMWLKPGEYKIQVEAYDGKTNTIEDLTIIIQGTEEPVIPESYNFVLIILVILVLLLLLIFLIIKIKKKDED